MSYVPPFVFLLFHQIGHCSNSTLIRNHASLSPCGFFLQIRNLQSFYICRHLGVLYVPKCAGVWSELLSSIRTYREPISGVRNDLAHAGSCRGWRENAIRILRPVRHKLPSWCGSHFEVKKTECGFADLLRRWGAKVEKLQQRQKLLILSLEHHGHDLPW